MNVIYIGQAELGSTSRVRFDILSELLNKDIKLINTSDFVKKSCKLSRSLGWRYFVGPLIWQINANIKKVIRCNQQSYDIVWIDKGVFIYPSVLRLIKKQAKILVHYTPDTAFFENNSRFFRKGMDVYDCLITTKSFDIFQYIKRVNENKIIYLTQGYNSRIHYPRIDFKYKQESIAFIGLCEPYREEVLEFLLQNGFHIVLGGYGWLAFLKKNRIFDSQINFVGELIVGDQYAEIISRSKFALGFLSKKFPETHTTRTFEIPACGTCLVTEENTEINKFFEDFECLKFNDNSQLLEKLRYLFNEPNALEYITRSGCKRVINDHRSYDYQLRYVLDHLVKIAS